MGDQVQELGHFGLECEGFLAHGYQVLGKTRHTEDGVRDKTRNYGRRSRVSGFAETLAVRRWREWRRASHALRFAKSAYRHPHHT